MNEFLGIIIVPLAFMLLQMMKLVFKKVNVFLLLAPVTTYAIHYIFTYIFNYSPLSYLWLLFTLLGIVMLFYSFRRNMRYTFMMFWKRLTITYSKVTLLVWFIMGTYQVINYFIV